MKPNIYRHQKRRLWQNVQNYQLYCNVKARKDAQLIIN